MLGMHRSGTSLAIRTANLLGVHLGTDQLFLPPSLGDNPKGYWEIKAINDLNDEVLAAWGGEWRAPPDLPPGWERDSRLDPLRTRAAELLTEIAGGERQGGIKDPRLCLTLPFWRTVIPQMSCIICVRNPLEVAASLNARNGMDALESHDLWVRYTGAALAATAGGRRLVVRFDDFFEDPDALLERIAGFLGRPAPDLDSTEREAVLAYIRDDLRHHRSTLHDAVRDGALTVGAKGLLIAVDALARASADRAAPAETTTTESRAAPEQNPTVSSRPARAPVLYLAPWVDYGGTAKGTLDWFRWIDRERFPPSLITTQAPSENRLLSEIVPLAEEVWPLPDVMPGNDMPAFICDFISSRGVGVVHIMNSRLGFELLPDICSLPDPPKTVVQLHVEEDTRAGYVRYVTTRYANLVDAFSITSHHLIDTVVNDYDVSPGKCRVIYTGVDADGEFSPSLVEPVGGLDERAVHILYIGRLVKQKDPLLMLDVVEALRSTTQGFKVHVVGYGDMEAAVRDEVDRRGLGEVVRFHGPTAQPAKWYAACDLMLMTSVFEGIPYVVFEAMAMEVPTVAPALPGMVELMESGAGRLVTPRDDVDAYVTALRDLIGDASARKRLGVDARAVVRERFSLARMGRQHDELYEQLLERRDGKDRPGMVV